MSKMLCINNTLILCAYMLVHCANVKCKANVGNDAMPNANKTKIQTNATKQMQYQA